MKGVIIFFAFMMYPLVAVSDGMTMIYVIKSCLYQQAIAKEITYSTIDTDAVVEDETYSKFGGANYVEYGGGTVGYGRYRDEMAFYKNKKPYPLSEARFINSGLSIKDHPKEIDYLASEWGSINLNGLSYVCVNVPFRGVGESGKHQSIRNVFVINETDKVLYYSVGNINDKS